MSFLISMYNPDTGRYYLYICNDYKIEDNFLTMTDVKIEHTYIPCYSGYPEIKQQISGKYEVIIKALSAENLKEYQWLSLSKEEAAIKIRDKKVEKVNKKHWLAKFFS